MSDLLWLATLGTGLWYWWDTVRTQEIAREAGKRACRQAEVQFLDDSVERKRQWFRRNSLGRIQLCRLYFFEFTSDGSQRYQGRVVMFGQSAREVELDAYRIPDEEP
ncbi:MAG: DUF3301 domain-containing protein [Ectothiorhodospiraceae bacterium]|nr:DUF3301 domain-containing protein [Ectothiorhodospiraceae bacterium]